MGKWLSGAAAAAGVAVSACAITDEGAIDLRRVGSGGEGVEPAWCFTCEEQNAGADGPMEKYAGGVSVSLEETVSISLRTVVVHDVSEGMSISPEFIHRAWTRKGNEPVPIKAEVAVLANVVEASRQADTSDKDLGDGRVVYYSDDVLDRQKLNQQNIPVYGPTPYKGGSLFVRFSIYEVDAEDAQVAGVLSALADAGGRAFPAYSPVLGVLNRVGASFANGAGPGSDRHFDYRVVFDAHEGKGNVRTFQLRTGDYVLLRSENRSAKFPWDRVYYDRSSGLLKHKGCVDAGDITKDCAYRDDSYVVFTINTGLPESGFAYQKTIADLERQLSQSNEASVRTAVLSSAVTELRAATTYDDISDALQEAANAQLPVRERLEGALSALQSLAESRCAEPSLLGEQRETTVLRRLRNLAVPGEDAQAKNLVSKLYPSEFDAAAGIGTKGADCQADQAGIRALAEAITKGFQEPAASAVEGQDGAQAVAPAPQPQTRNG